MATENGGPAFPASEVDEVFVEEFGRWDKRLGPPTGGMSLRDYFAAQAARQSADVVCDMLGDGKDADAVVEAAKHARAAYIVADAMLVERAK